MRFRHYKTRNLYDVVGEAQHSETMEDLVLYKSVETGHVWARPTEMFYEMVKAESGEMVRRFEPVSDKTLK